MDIKELVDLCKKGNEQALSLLYKTYSKKMMEYAFIIYLINKSHKISYTTDSLSFSLRLRHYVLPKNWKAGWE